MTDTKHDTPTTTAPGATPGQLPAFEAPHDWAAIDHAVRTTGGAIVKDLLSDQALATFNNEIDTYLAGHASEGVPGSGSDSYDQFLGHNTIRLHGLLNKIPSGAELVGHAEIVAWAERLLADAAGSVLLNAGELIQIQPGEPAQAPHRDSDSWPGLPLTDSPVVVNAIVALDDCTLDNGATHVVPGSWEWARERRPSESEWTRAVIDAGDALVFRGDVIHRGGANRSDERRRVVSLSYCAGWLRPVENSFLNIPRETAAAASPDIQALLGYAAHDGSSMSAGLVGLYENGDPARALAR